MLLACSQESTTPLTDGNGKPAYLSLDKDLGQLRADFNAMADKVRLVFISGPSCGICLRGMDDLNESIVASLQNDPRIHTFVVYVPTLGAEEKHVAAAVPLMQGPRIGHYWDEEGNSGLEFQQALGIPMYAWDVWMMYEPGQRWEPGSAPPAPVFWQHQLPGLPENQRFDAGDFARVITARLAELPPASEAAKLAVARRDPGLLKVAQPRGVVIQQNHKSRGGYRKLKAISSIRYEGDMEINGHSYYLTVETARPHHYKRTVSDGARNSTVRWNGAEIVRDGPPMGLPVTFQDELLRSFEFDGWMTDWKAKGHQVWRLGMKKVGGRLPWIMEAELANGRTWHIYVDSHTGDAFRQALMGADGKEMIALEFDDYRESDGFRLPHQVRYFNGDRLLATERFDQIEVTVTSDVPMSGSGG
jgi:hypothetical protein